MIVIMRWKLDVLYTSFDSHEFCVDMKKCKEDLKSIEKWVETNAHSDFDASNKIETYLNMLNSFYDRFNRLYQFAELTFYEDNENQKSLEAIADLQRMKARSVKPLVTFQKWISTLENLNELIQSSAFLKEHKFYLTELVENNEYVLTEKSEEFIAEMENMGSNIWTRMHNELTSNLMVNVIINDEQKLIPLSMARNMAYDKNFTVRKNAYEAEMKAYSEIENACAACLNGIKGEVITLSEMRGYSSPLKKTLLDQKMSGAALDTMISAIQEKLPSFHAFYRRKAELLDAKNGLPFFELFAPLDTDSLTFTFEQAKDLIIENFGAFSDSMGCFAKKAFQESWIDAEPRKGKRGGALCVNLYSVRESRILCNFTGSLSDVVTLAHELGHGYHNECLRNQSYVNSKPPLPIAETASIFSEIIVKQAELQKREGREKYIILENDVSQSSKAIVDVYSRFLFETELFKRRRNKVLSPIDLKNMMEKSQMDSYGISLDHDFLHPYMWICKAQYYYADNNFYNFPYTFGLLFSKVLYEKYVENKSSFVKLFDQFLSVSGQMSIRTLAKKLDIDVESMDFWRGSLRIVEEDINRFLLYK